jgi:hypothetical protein
MAHALTFDPHVNVVEPSSLLRKRPLIVERGRFDTFDPYQATMLRAAQQQLREEGIECERDPTPVLEMTLRHVDGSPGPEDAEILQRTERLAKFGAVVVSDYPQTYLLVQYLRRHTAEPVRFVVGASGLAQLLHRAHYEELPGSLLEGLGRFLATNVKIYCSAMPADVFRRLIGNSMPEILAAAPTTGMVTADDIHPPPPVSHLYAYLRESGKIVPLSQ